MKKTTKTYIVSILATWAVGLLSGLLTRGSMESFELLNKPPLSPPGFLFPIVWGILYTLMGVSMARVLLSPASSCTKKVSLQLYTWQLVFNFFWSIIFFNFEAYLVAFIWLLALLVLIILMIFSFFPADRIAALLQIPYIMWVTFAGYLNLAIFLLNR